ncbi:ABC transporter ATP-binding protein [Rhodovulum sp. BSW8]|uniref:ATP-binding cassette domain-containing protein n=1 Tax=Rhodovulum sp. BSW8 TaxID=2259645 RepID=UPI000DE247CC|nr:ATP-binding cassette domain-containing protein [Rhodovulum sp. BSW8]RBO53446.1 ABC transporter ATP-binding protein [Rhodovulum sp. BSW8]
MIEVRSLSYAAGATPILHEVGLDLAPRGITALIGPNGAGKSTLLHCIAGLARPGAGTVRIDGLDPFAVPDRRRARQVALLQQSPTVASRLRVAELVGFGRWPHHAGRPGPEDARVVAEALTAFELDALAARPLDTLSGGQRQRAMVAMAYAQATPWLLLDEPLNALDPRHARDLMARLHDLSRPGPDGRAVVVVLHDINAAALWADRVVAMKDGRVIAAARADEVLRAEILEEVFDTRFEIVPHRGRQLVVTL